MNFCVAGIPQRVEAASPRSNRSRDGQQNQSSEGCSKHDQDRAPEQCLELFVGNFLAHEFNESNELQKTKDTYKSQLVVLCQGPRFVLPNADICSLLRMGRNPTKGICILAKVPSANQVL